VGDDFDIFQMIFIHVPSMWPQNIKRILLYSSIIILNLFFVTGTLVAEFFVLFLVIISLLFHQSPNFLSQFS